MSLESDLTPIGPILEQGVMDLDMFREGDRSNGRRRSTERGG
jgi:hypothetical protein